MKQNKKLLLKTLARKLPITLGYALAFWGPSAPVSGKSLNPLYNLH
ncbi:MAG: hypothetical protein II415_01750 [Bacteroidaceae bacterium]|nr:hypothetical protein [Bacteroidaceae bacterium]